MLKKSPRYVHRLKTICLSIDYLFSKEMELWAKKEREKKEKEAKRKAQLSATTAPSTTSTGDSTSNLNTTASGTTSSSSSSSFADVGLLSTRSTGGLISLNLMSSSSGASSTNRPTLLAAFDNPDSDDNDESTVKPSTTTTTGSTSILDASEEKLVDWNKLACLLCQRQFDTREVLEKHLQMSNLHKVSTLFHLIVPGDINLCFCRKI